MSGFEPSAIWRHVPQDWREMDGWSAELECGHTSPAYSSDGRPYGRPEPGSFISCRPCQGQRKVKGVWRVPREV